MSQNRRHPVSMGTNLSMSHVRSYQREAGRGRESRLRSDSSSSHRRRSKWSLKRYTHRGKDVWKLNPHELIVASKLWCLDLQSLTVADYRAFLEHINCIRTRARDDYFKDSAHVDYVVAVHVGCRVCGVCCFRKSNGTEIYIYICLIYI